MADNIARGLALNLNRSVTWNNGATTFTGFKLNVTDTASNASSLLMDLQLFGLSRFKVSRLGAVTNTGAINATGNILGLGFFPGNGADAGIVRDAANTLAQRNGTNAQTFNLHLTYTDGSNFGRLALVAGASNYRITSQAAGTGATKPIVTDFYSSTVDPTATDIPAGTSAVWKNTTDGVLKLWANDGGVLKSVALA